MNQQVLVEETISLAAVVANLNALYTTVEDFWAATDQILPQPLGYHWRLEFSTALIEIATNIMCHAYPATIEFRPMGLRLCLYSNYVEACFTDQGVAYSSQYASTALSTHEIYTVPEGGYGIKIAHSVVDLLDYWRTSAGVNHWRLLKNYS